MECRQCAAHERGAGVLHYFFVSSSVGDLHCYRGVVFWRESSARRDFGADPGLYRPGRCESCSDNDSVRAKTSAWRHRGDLRTGCAALGSVKRILTEMHDAMNTIWDVDITAQ